MITPHEPAGGNAGALPTPPDRRYHQFTLCALFEATDAEAHGLFEELAAYVPLLLRDLVVARLGPVRAGGFRFKTINHRAVLSDAAPATMKGLLE